MNVGIVSLAAFLADVTDLARISLQPLILMTYFIFWTTNLSGKLLKRPR